ncbi:hypothetical protein PMIN02_011126 [Paraphaeosphaeria minitans]|uniref:MFS quinate transporter n=1 Tax=Paraphaeosphaeria minitans TaxID=565426 RepID=A0A9P6G9J1_9PLEO|nr:MFS quinate transporter [Paraphaeosphaeria minitans]
MQSCIKQRSPRRHLRNHAADHACPRLLAQLGQFITAGLLLISMPFILESPCWLVSKSRIFQTTKALCWVRNLPAEHIYIVAEIEHNLSLGGPGIRNPDLISVLLMLLLRNLTGINATNYDYWHQYGTFIFFGSRTAAALVFAYFIILETKGVALEDMDCVELVRRV